MRTFYVCSYGGSGSKMLCRYLENFGRVFHIHSRKPPNKLEKVGITTYHEWFNNKQIPPHKVKNFTVIFIYRNPVYCIYSRYVKINPEKNHLEHVQCPDVDVRLDDVLEKKEDLFGITEFFDNYTTPNPKRNYKIHCVKYEDFFDNISIFNKHFGLEDNPELYPNEKKTKRPRANKKDLQRIYIDLIRRQNEMNFIEVC